MGRPFSIPDALERAGWSAGQAFFGAIMVGGSINPEKFPWGALLTTALFAGMVSIVLTGVESLVVGRYSRFWTDLVIRLAKTFLATFTAALAVEALWDTPADDWIAAVNLAAITTLAALGKAVLAAEPDKGRRTPSSLPTETYFDAARQDPAPVSP